MGGEASHISTLAETELHALDPYAMPFVPLYKKVLSSYCKQSARLVSTVIDIDEPYRNEINFSLPVNSISTAVNRTPSFKVDHVISDELYLDRYFVEAIKDKTQKVTMILRPFRNYDGHDFAQILDELSFTQEVSKAGAESYCLLIVDQYINSSGLTIEQPYSLVMQMEGVDCSLREMVEYRRKYKQEWASSEFGLLYNNLMAAVKELHSKGFYHNDIRPTNIFYSAARKRFLLGGFSLASRSRQIMYPIEPHSCYRLEGQLDCVKNDTYGVAMTLLSTFFYANSLSESKALEKVASLKSSYPLLSRIEKMIRNHQLPEELYKRQTTEPHRDMLQAIVRSHRADKRDIERNSVDFTDAIMRLGLLNEWKEELLSQLEQQEHPLPPLKQAELMLQIASVCQGDEDYEAANQYSRRSCAIFNTISSTFLAENKEQEAKNVLNEATNCRPFMLNQTSPQMIKTYELLSNYLLRMGDFKGSESTLDEAENCAKNLNEDILIQIHQIYLKKAEVKNSQFQLEGAKEQLGRAAQTIDLIKDPREKILAQARYIEQEAKIELERLSEIQNSQLRMNGFKQIDEKLNDIILAVAQQNGETRLLMAELVETLGHSYYDQQKYQTAKRSFETANKFRTDYLYMKPMNSEVQRLIADTQSLSGTCSAKNNDNEVAFDNYQKALQIYRKIFGTDRSQESAMVLGNIGKLHYSAQRYGKAQECLSLAINFLEQTGNTQNEQYQPFKAAKAKIDQLKSKI